MFGRDGPSAGPANHEDTVFTTGTRKNLPLKTTEARRTRRENTEIVFLPFSGTMTSPGSRTMSASRTCCPGTKLRSVTPGGGHCHRAVFLKRPFLLICETCLWSLRPCRRQIETTEARRTRRHTQRLFGLMHSCDVGRLCLSSGLPSCPCVSCPPSWHLFVHAGCPGTAPALSPHCCRDPLFLSCL